MSKSFSNAALTVWPHYDTENSIKSIADLKALFPTGKANTLNWCVFSTSGVHGTYTTLDEIEKPEDDEPFNELTVLVIHPRLVVLKYGCIEVEKEDIPWLRGLVKSSLEAISESQKGNLPAGAAHPPQRTGKLAQ